MLFTTSPTRTPLSLLTDTAAVPRCQQANVIYLACKQGNVPRTKTNNEFESSYYVTLLAYLVCQLANVVLTYIPVFLFCHKGALRDSELKKNKR